MKRTIALVLILCAACGARGQNLFERYAARLTEPRVYDCFRTADGTENRLHIDGRLDEPVWQRTVSVEPFVDIRGKDFPAPAQNTSVRLLWDDDQHHRTSDTA